MKKMTARKEALKKRIKTYKNPNPCKRCGGVLYRAANASCVQCNRTFVREYARRCAEALRNSKNAGDLNG